MVSHAGPGDDRDGDANNGRHHPNSTRPGEAHRRSRSRSPPQSALKRLFRPRPSPPELFSRD
jgi:hypothetical protein